MVLLGDEAASVSTAYFPRKICTRSRNSIASLGLRARPKWRRSVLQEYQPPRVDPGLSGGRRPGRCGELLKKAFGRGRSARALLEQVMEEREESHAQFRHAAKADPQTLGEICPGRASADHRDGAGAAGREDARLVADAAAGKAAGKVGQASGGNAAILAGNGAENFDGSAPEICRSASRAGARMAE